MSNEQLFIASKIKVGFQKRQDTYTGSLAYVTYFDLKGVLRKEKSWEGWRDKSIEPVEFDNVPTEGFVLNKKVGGKGWSSWDTRQEYVRVYDPRNFEFEITVPNLLFILRECDCSRGKGLEGKFVYAWSGTTLVLLPASSEEYKKSESYTNLQAKTIKAKELVKGASYLTKKQEKWIYIDRRIKYNADITEGHWYYYRDTPSAEFLHVFWNTDEKKFIFQKDMKNLAAVISESPDDSYAGLVEMYDKSEYGSPPVRLFTVKQPPLKIAPERYWIRHSWAKEAAPGVFHQYHTEVYSEVDNIRLTSKITLQDSLIPKCLGTKFVKIERGDKVWYSDKHRHGGGHHGFGVISELEVADLCLCVELASGSKFKIENSYLTPIGDIDGEDGRTDTQTDSGSGKAEEGNLQG